MSTAIALALKPLILIALFGAARLLAWGIMRALPDGKLKRWLGQERGGF